MWKQRKTSFIGSERSKGKRRQSTLLPHCTPSSNDQIAPSHSALFSLCDGCSSAERQPLLGSVEVGSDCLSSHYCSPARPVLMNTDYFTFHGFTVTCLRPVFVSSLSLHFHGVQRPTVTAASSSSLTAADCETANIHPPPKGRLGNVVPSRDSEDISIARSTQLPLFPSLSPHFGMPPSLSLPPYPLNIHSAPPRP